MRLWLDTEFNGFQGSLISMALVADNESEWYEVLPCKKPIPWVAENVIPRLGKKPINRFEMADSLQIFLNQFDSAHIVADWPEDISHFCNILITGPGACLLTPPLTFELRGDLHTDSRIPHNALEDAKALRVAGMFQLTQRKEGKDE